MTMLRIWSGGVYEHDHFYAEWHRLGLLVWQDFMFASAMYDDEDAATRSAEQPSWPPGRERSPSPNGW